MNTTRRLRRLTKGLPSGRAGQGSPSQHLAGQLVSGYFFCLAAETKFPLSSNEKEKNYLPWMPFAHYIRYPFLETTFKNVYPFSLKNMKHNLKTLSFYGLLQGFLVLTITLFTPFFGLYAQPAPTPGAEKKLISAPKVDAEVVQNVIVPETLGEGRQEVIETRYYQVTIHSKGAHITKFNHIDPDNPLIINAELVDGDPFLFDVYQNESNMFAYRKANFNLKKTESDDFVQVTASLPVQIQTESRKGNVIVHKIFRFHKTQHYWDFKWEVSNLTRKTIRFRELFFLPLRKIGPPPSSTGSSISRSGYNVFYYADNDFETHVNFPPSEGSGGIGGFFCSGSEPSDEAEIIENKIDYFGMSSRFMVLTIQPLSGTNKLFHYTTSLGKELHVQMDSLDVAPGVRAGYDFLLYTGPKVNHFLKVEIDDIKANARLKHVHEDLYKAFDFGITAPIRDLIVIFLKFFYNFIPNYGIGIIIFAVLFKVVFFPLNQAQANSMKKMQVLQPELKIINEKYKNNPQEKQKKIMELYQKHKANPLGGCLPMVIQVPIFIALYSAFSSAYELWQSPFVLWITDLSEPDTLYTFDSTLPLLGGFNLNILPLVMVVSQYLQTSLTMVSGDANQQRMMKFLPLVMLIFFWNMPSGVVLYWIMFNLLSVLQQFYTNIKKDEQAA